MRWIGTLTRFWAWLSTALVGLIILFLFGYVFEHGAGNISLEFLTQSPKGMVLGSEGGIWPAIAGSLYFTGAAVEMGSIPAVAVALYQVFYCKNKKRASLIRLVMECISGLPSIVLGLFSYTVLVRDIGLGRCILSASAALAIMILPFIEVRAEKAFREVPESVVQSACALGCSKAYTIRKVVFPACRGELVSGHDPGRLLRHGRYGTGHVHGSRSVCDRTPQPACSGHVAAAASVSAAVPGGNLHACSVWDSICNDAADPGGKYGGSRVCGALSETVERVETGGVKIVVARTRNVV